MTCLFIVTVSRGQNVLTAAKEKNSMMTIFASSTDKKKKMVDSSNHECMQFHGVCVLVLIHREMNAICRRKPEITSD